MVDEVLASSYFLGSLRFAAQEERALTRLPKTLAVLATLLLAVLAASAGTRPAAAHGNHVHQGSTTGPGFSAPTAEPWQWTQNHVTASTLTENELPDRHAKSDCCCGNVMCHASVTLAVDPFPFLCPTGARLIPEPSSGLPQRDSSGLERPPRSRDIA